HGVVVDPGVLLKEIEQLRERSVEPKNLVVSDRAHMVMSYHPTFDRLEEEARGDDRLGTTWRGIGPAYSDKVRRIGFRIGDLQKPAFMRKKLDFVVGQLKNDILRDLYHEETLDPETMLGQYLEYAQRLEPFIEDTYPLIQGALDNHDPILVEGAQATMLDLDLGTYPYVTSSNTTAGGAIVGAGIPPTRLDLSIAVVKAYTSRVGYGPFPTELLDETGERIREAGHEFGTVTGRARRVGWFDAAVVRYAVRMSGAEAIALTKLDILDELPEVKVCTGYEFRGRRWDHPMANISWLKHCTPILETLPGWERSIGECRTWEDLPESCRRYIERLEDLSGARVRMLGVGPRRDQFIERGGPLLG
ncbi:MAG: adenylosuccinate synthase, partial [Candidatus Dormibacteraceae bacterium]